MKKIMIILIILFAAGLGAKTVLHFRGDAVRNWSLGSDTICITVDAADLSSKKQGAEKVWIVLSVRYLGKRFWKFYPEFTEKCIVGKKYDFKWVEAISIEVSKVTSNSFIITGAKGAYYGFVLVEKGGILSVVKNIKIGGNRQFKKGFPSDSVKVNNPTPLKRIWDNHKRKLCR